jgi:hypothetical protein
MLSTMAATDPAGGWERGGEASEVPWNAELGEPAVRADERPAR